MTNNTQMAILQKAPKKYFKQAILFLKVYFPTFELGIGSK